MREWLRTLEKDIDQVTHGGGRHVLTQLFFTYFFFCKSLCDGFVSSSIYVYYTNELAVDTNRLQVLITVARCPWGVKALWGSTSDMLPIYGYHKRFYIFAAVLVACVSIIFLAAWTPTGQYKVEIATLCFFGLNFGGATVDSLTQARYTEIMKQSNNVGVVSFVWGLINNSRWITAPANLLVDYGSKILLWLAIPFALPVLIPAAKNYLCEEQREGSLCKPDVSKFKTHPRIFGLAMLLSFGVIAGNVLILLTSQATEPVPSQQDLLSICRVFLSDVQFMYFFILSVVVIAVSFKAFPANIAKPNLYMFICSAFRLNFGAQLQTFYTNECIPNGPQFSNKYYQFVGTLIGAGAGALAIVIFEKYMKTWKCRTAFWVTTAVCCVAAFIELIILERWNHLLFGTTPGTPEGQWVDQLFFIVGAQAMEDLVHMLDFLPSTVLLGKLCPNNIEATVFAILAGMNNFGSSISSITGALVLRQILGVHMHPASGQCYNEPIHGISGLGWAKLIGFCFLPFLTIPFTWVLLPDIRLDEDFEVDDPREVYLSTTSSVSIEVRSGPARLSLASGAPHSFFADRGRTQTS